MRLSQRLSASVDRSFWLGAFFLAWSGAPPGDPLRVPAMAIWLAVVFVAVAVHEGGHALAALSFGARAHVRLHGMGGETRHETVPPLRGWRRLTVTAAGPAAGFALAGACLLLGIALSRAGAFRAVGQPYGALAAYGLYVLQTASFYWSLFNLVPILPLDGGALVGAVLHERWGLRGLRASFWIGLASGAALVLYFLSTGQRWNAMIASVFALGNLTRLQALARLENASA